MADNDVTFSRIPADVAQRWALVRAICACDESVLEKYLPTLNSADKTAQNAARNKTYRDNAVLYNVTGQTRNGLVGLAFSRDPKTDNLPSRLQYLLKDADGAGVTLFQQAQATLSSVLETARHGLFVDFSAAARRPVIKAYRAEDIINWRATMVDGVAVLTLLVLHEFAEVDSGYAVSYVDQWRELRMELVGGKSVCISRVWQKPDPRKPPVQIGSDVILRSPGSELEGIPFRFVGAENNDSNIDDAPLYPLAYLNRHHYRNSADYEDSVFYCGQAQPWMSGLTEEWRDWMQDKGIYVGSRAPILLPAGGVYDFAQAEPNTLAMEAMKHKEDQMRALGARLVEETKAHTATQSDNDKESSTSVLSTCVGNVTSAYQAAIDLCARYLDIEPAEGSFEINKDFVRLLADAQTVESMVSAWQTGRLIAKSDVRSFMRERSFIAADRSDADIDAELALETPPAVDGTTPTGAQPTATEPTAAATLAATAPAVDFGPLIAAIQAHMTQDRPEPQAPVITVNTPEVVVTVNVPEQPAPTVNIAPAAVTVNTPDVNVAAPNITVEAPQITVNPPEVNVAAPTVNVQPAQVVQAKASQIEFQTDANGDITGASLT